jgi:hypothetical protein
MFKELVKINNDAAEEAKRVLKCLETSHQNLSEKEARMQQLHAKWESTVQLMRDNCAKAADTITLNLRGRVFKTYKDTLLKKEGTFFYNMLSSGEWLPDDKGEYFIDRGSEGFDRILDYLSSGEILYEGLNKYEEKVLKANLDYFQIAPALPPLLWSLESVTNPLINGFTLSNGSKSVRVSGRINESIRTNISADRFRVHVSNSAGIIGFSSIVPYDYTDPATGTLYTDVQLLGFQTCNGRLYVITSNNTGRHVSKSFVRAKPNSIITAIYDRVKHEIHFEVDDQDIGVCFGNITVNEMFPAAAAFISGLKVTLL